MRKQVAHMFTNLEVQKDGCNGSPLSSASKCRIDSRRRRNLGRRWSFPACLSLVVVSQLAVGCNSDGGAPEPEQSRTVRAEIVAGGNSPLNNDTILGFEAGGAWSTTTAGAILNQASTHSQGSFALSVRPSSSNGFTPVASVPISTVAGVSPTLAVDVMLPTFQPNPNWLGTVQIYLNCPSRSINSQFLGQVELTGKPLNVWNTLNFPLNNAEVTGLLRAGYTDLTITIVLNVQVPTTGTYFIDNVRFVPAAAKACNGLPNGTACTDGNACTTGDTCQSGTCRAGTAVTCATPDQCHSAGTCSPSTGVCSNPQKSNGTLCSDGNACTQTDTCVAGVCTGGSNQPCGTTCGDKSLCDASGNCVSVAQPTVCGPDSHPKPNEVIVWQDPHYTGTCATLHGPGGYPDPSSLQPVHNDSISSVRVGCGVRALLFHDAVSDVPTSTPVSYCPPQQYCPPIPDWPAEPGKYWYSSGHRATYEAGSSHEVYADDELFQLGPNVNDHASAIIVEAEDNRRVAYSYLGDSPGDSGVPLYNEQPQGIAHSHTDWFFTNMWTLFKIPLDYTLDSNTVSDYTCLGNLSKGSFFGSSIPGWLEDACHRLPPPPAGIEGCDHMGDPDYADYAGVGYVFLPLEGCNDSKARIAVYRADDLSLLGATPVSDGTAGWVAIEPDSTGTERTGTTLWASDGSHAIKRYNIRWDRLVGGQPPVRDFLDPINTPCGTTRESWCFVHDPPVAPVDLKVGGQGGVFDPSGRILYLSDSSEAYHGINSAYHGIMAVNPDNGELLTKTGDHYGPFSFQREYSDQEEEGIDYLDQLDHYKTYGQLTAAPGELHALLNFNDWSNVSVKHYTAWPENYCKTYPDEYEVTLWSEANFKGVCRTLQVGQHPDSRWMAPMPNDWTSSLRIGAKVQATIFDNSNYGGASKTIRGDAIDSCDPIQDSKTKGQISNLGVCGWGYSDHPQISSIKVTNL